MLNKMVLFLDVPEQGLTGKIDVFLKICEFLLVFASRAWNFNFTPLLSDMNFTKNWLCVTKRITSFADVEMPQVIQNLFHVNRIFFELLAIAWQHFTHIHSCIKQLLLDCLNTNQADKIQSLH